MASKSKGPLYLGLAAAGGVGYYLYRAGGQPRAAEKKMESESFLNHRLFSIQQPPSYPILDSRF